MTVPVWFVLLLLVAAVCFFVNWLGASVLVTFLVGVIALLVSGICIFLSQLKLWR